LFNKFVERTNSNAETQRVIYHSLKSPACSCVSITLPAASQAQKQNFVAN
jgi:hypothetical protein